MSVGCAGAMAQRVSSRKDPSQRKTSLSVRSFYLSFLDDCAVKWNANKVGSRLKPNPRP